MNSSQKSPRIAIIGAGIAGISAGRELYKNGFRNFVIFEASHRIGGRIQTVELEKGFIELGAQWIHGEADNSVYEYAFKRDLANTSDYSLEGKGTYCNENGQLLNCDLLDDMIAFLDRQKRDMKLTEASKMTVHSFFQSKLNEYIQKKDFSLTTEEIKLCKQTFRWFVIFELIDNSCDSLHTLSPLSYTEWEDCDGSVDLINPFYGYQSILHSFMSLPDDLNQNEDGYSSVLGSPSLLDYIKLETQVESLDFNPNTCKVKLFATSKSVSSIEEFDHVIVTSSLGFLKENLVKFFKFELSPHWCRVVKSLGFGTMNKIFLEFEHPFWSEKEKSFQVIWTNVMDEHSYQEKSEKEREEEPKQDKVENDERIIRIEEEEAKCSFPKWVFSIQSFDRVRGQPNMLMAWIGGQGAIQMEHETDPTILEVCHRVLCAIIPDSRKIRSIDVPERVHVTRWNSNPYMKGSYSNRTLDYEHCELPSSFNFHIEALQEPIRLENFLEKKSVTQRQNPGNYLPVTEERVANCLKEPLICFAGEATDLKHYSTTHGAFDSGVREAQRLMNFFKKPDLSRTAL